MREEGGLLWWTSRSCRVESVDVSSGAVVEATGEHCRTWPSPTGTAAIAVSTRRSDALAGRGLVLLEDRGRTERVVEHTPGILGSELAWQPDGAAFAACFGTREGTTVDVVSRSGERAQLTGECFPAWLADGRLATAAGPPRTIAVDGVPLAAGAELARFLPRPDRGERVAVSAMAGGGSRVVVGLSTVSPTRLLPAAAALAVVSEAGAVEFGTSLPIRAFPTAVGEAPHGSGVWYFDAGQGAAVVLRLPSGHAFPLADARWVSWSPTGAFLAVATGLGIRILDWPSGQEIAVLPVDAVDVTWTRKP